MKNGLITSNYNSFVREIKQRIRSAQYEALKAVNKELRKELPSPEHIQQLLLGI